MNLTPDLIAKIIDRSISIAILCVICYTIWGKSEKNEADNQELHLKIDNLQTEFREYIREDHAHATDVIEKSTEINRRLVLLLEK